MNRRKFCKLAAGSALMAMLAPSKVFGAVGTRRSCVVSVVRCECFGDLQSRFASDPEAGSCPLLKPGMSWDVSGGEMPLGMCPKAWSVISAHIRDEYGVCSKSESSIVACPDGIRPVIFKITYN
ncbi:MAG: TIGR04076 family protein [Paramuribaculum sp.]|nr:TIGR04076 family protein [Paramuribaculum sp.]